mgnify:CR=1 FL=1
MAKAQLNAGMSIDGFVLAERLHRGGMAAIWSVTRPDIDFPIVMKVPFLDYEGDLSLLIGFEVEQMIMAELKGIHVPRLITITYGTGVALAAFAGVLAAPIYSGQPQMGADLLIVVFAVVVIGGIGPGAANMVSGVVTAFAEGSPLIVLSGQRRRSIIYPDRGGSFQNVDLLGLYRPVTRWCAGMLSMSRLEPPMRPKFQPMPSSQSEGNNSCSTSPDSAAMTVAASATVIVTTG